MVALMRQTHMVMWLNNQVKSRRLPPPDVAHVVLLEQLRVLQAKSILQGQNMASIRTTQVSIQMMMTIGNEATGLALKKIWHSSQLSLKDMMICLELTRSVHLIPKNAGMKSQHLSTA
ncbi:hypothetical protein XELAEV_18044644mg [Xenopus laevis]|uniref:Uncharacterized protein n=1 Tax=Xenopus laevis TaxID=8355 RepID=A0A974BZ49_XENLA|nr:hypothetical protein XELAEV_18044644mg [Xenopus laevis]